MPVREIRHIGIPWQVTTLPDGTREIAFPDPNGVDVHIYPLKREAAEAMASQLRGVEVAPAHAIEKLPRPEMRHEDGSQG